MTWTTFALGLGHGEIRSRPSPAQAIVQAQDSVSRGTATINPDLGLDEVGVPEEWAWTTYKNYVQKRLVNQGYSPADEVMSIRVRSTRAKQALDAEVKVRPAIFSRAPAWHKFNSIAGNVKLTQGNTLETNPFITTGFRRTCCLDTSQCDGQLDMMSGC